MAVSFIGGGLRSIREKTTDLSPVTDKLYHIRLVFGTIRLLSIIGNVLCNLEKTMSYVKDQVFYRGTDKLMEMSRVLSNQ